jgi:nucleotide-binding universal stress UspA family protein
LARFLRFAVRKAAVIEFTRILCPMDVSETAKSALVHATALAEWYDAKLTVLHVVRAAPCPVLTVRA